MTTKKHRWAPGAPALADAARALTACVYDGHSADAALAPFATAPDRAAVRAITLGSARWYLRLAPAVETLLTRPEGVAREVRALLVASAHQIEYSRNPPQTIANAAVDAVRILGQQRVAGLVNAVLRRFVADRAALLERVDADLAGRTAHPTWLVEALKKAWPDRLEAILAANNAHPPMTLRVDASRVSIQDYVAELNGAGIGARSIDWVSTAVQLDHPVAVAALPGFREGKVSVQDAGAQLAAVLLDVRAGMRVLDACAAPGGKTGHLLERTPDVAELVAVDIDDERAKRIRDNLKRLRRTARIVVADIRDPGAYWDRKPFDRILVDAPCSATGVIRRHPDIKLLRRSTDIPVLATTQLAILGACFSMLAPGGKLIYGTCSVLPVENEGVVARFLEVEAQARAVKIVSLPPGAIEKSLGFQLLPSTEASPDGFYYACLEKTTTGT